MSEKLKFESLKKEGIRRGISKKINKIFFELGFDDMGAFISVVNENGTEVLDFDYRAFDRNSREVLKNIDIIKDKNAFIIDWNKNSEKVYLKDNPFMITLLKKCSNFVTEDMKKINFEEGILKVRCIIAEKEEFIYTDIFLETGEKFLFLTENFVFSNEKVYEVEPVGENFLNLSLFSERFKKSYLENYLSLIFSYFDNIEIDYMDFKVSFEESQEAVPVIIFEKIDSNKSLYLKTGISAGNLDFQFLNDYEVSAVAVINDVENKIVVGEIDDTKATEMIETIMSNLSKRQKILKIKEGYFTEENLIILKEAIAIDFITQEISFIFSNFKVLGAEKLDKYKLKVIKPGLKVNLSHSIDFFEGDAYLEIEGEKFSVFDAITKYKTNSYIALSDGTNALINKDYMEKLERIFKKKKENVRISFFDLPIIEELIGEKMANDTFKKSREIFEGFNNIKKSVINLPKISGELREYQKDGIKWMKYLLDNNLGGCLADDMGLGKTVQAISILSFVYPKEKLPTLIIMPKSLIFNWENEIKKFNKNLTYYVYYGVDRDFEDALKYNVILTTYGMVRNDVEIFKDSEYEMIILDESQNIKNLNSQITKAVMLLNAKRRFALSGTPVENNLGELYSLFSFLNPSMFGTISDFNRYYAVPIQRDKNEEVIKELKKKIYPFILRRTKKEVLKDLPEKIEQLLYVEMESEQAKLYEERRRFYKDFIKSQVKIEGIEKSQFFIFQALMELRQIASNPEVKTDGAIVSPKRELLMENIIDAVSNNHKVLVFTNFLNVIETLEKEMQENAIPYLSMSGATVDRKSLVEKFQKDKKYKVFIMTLKVGGVGLNLTAADTIFIYDPWWNKAAEDQAIDRAHRIGQDRTVFSYKLITKGTIEEKILLLQEKKKELFEALISSDTASIKSLTEEDIEFILGE